MHKQVQTHTNVHHRHAQAHTDTDTRTKQRTGTQRKLKQQTESVTANQQTRQASKQTNHPKCRRKKNKSHYEGSPHPADKLPKPLPVLLRAGIATPPKTTALPKTTPTPTLPPPPPPQTLTRVRPRLRTCPRPLPHRGLRGTLRVHLTWLRGTVKRKEPYRLVECCRRRLSWDLTKEKRK